MPMLIRRRRVLVARLALSATVATLGAAPQARVAAQGLPARISDDAFWRMVTEFSEPGGFFRSDNFVSNETTFQYVIPTLLKTTTPGGVYLGVGPDQNFTYLVALRPKIAFLFDIRRQNMVQHLLYKALLDLAPDRADFLSRLFSRPRPAGLTASSSVEALFDAYAAVAPDSMMFRKSLAAVTDQLVKHHGFALTAEDLKSLAYVYSAFYTVGPELTYSFAGPGGAGQFYGRRMPTYGALMMETDGQGEHRSYLASEANFRILKDLEAANLIVPLVGDFAGDKAIVAVGRYLKEHRAAVTAFYTSNVEQYLFRQGDDWRKFFTNVAALPVDANSTFIRAVFNTGGFRDQPPIPRPRSETLLCSIPELIKAFNEGRVQTYYDVIQMSK